MVENLQGKTAVITGAGRGIGKAIALRLGREGLQLTLVGRNKKNLDKVAEEITALDGQTLQCSGDLADPSFPSRVVQETVSRFGGLDILINNAGIALSKPLEETTTQDWDYQIAVNARAPFLLCREAIPHLKKSLISTVVNISSVVGTKGYVNQGAYTASKHALMGLSKVLARELHSSGVRVHVVSPGGVATDLITSMRPDLLEKALISPEEMADIIWFLLSHRGNAVIDEVNVRRISNEPWK